LIQHIMKNKTTRIKMTGLTSKKLTPKISSGNLSLNSK